MTNSREIATQILTDISEKEKFFETAIFSNRGFNRLDKRDKAFVKLLVLNTLRRNGQIIKVIKKLVKNPIKRRDFFVLNLIKISICQILFLDIKEYSIVNTAVEISKKYKLEKFVNGLLRNICRKKKEILLNIKIESNLPRWIGNDIAKNFGGNYLKKLSKSLIEEPLIDIKIKEEYLKKRNWERILNGKFVANDIIRIENTGPIEDKPFYNDGYWWVQGLSATLPVKIITKIYKNNHKKDISVLEVGAAPGGKTFQLIEKGFRTTSIEISNRRTKRLKENLNRLKYKTKILCKNFLDMNFNEKYDCVLIDAPCSASGLIQKKPEILIKNKEINIKELAKKQNLMLSKSKYLVKNGGYIIYCVCSIHSKETTEIIEKFLKKNKCIESVSVDSEICNLGVVIKNGMLMILPDTSKVRGGLDGFFISILRKKNDH